MFNRTGTRQAKYRNKKCEYMGMKFDSQIERDRYIFLKDQEAQGKIKNLLCQAKFQISVKEKKICDYVADFMYDLMSPEPAPGNRDRHLVQLDIVEDVKGFAITREFVIKKKLLYALYGLEIQIVTKATSPVGIQPPKPKKSKTLKKGKLKL